MSKSVVAHRRPGGQSVSVKSNVQGTANVAYVLSCAKAEFGENHILVTNDVLQLHDSAGTNCTIFTIQYFRAML